MNNDIKLIESALYDYIPKGLTYEKALVDSIAYSLKAGGKRIRYLRSSFRDCAAAMINPLCLMPARLK